MSAWSSNTMAHQASLLLTRTFRQVSACRQCQQRTLSIKQTVHSSRQQSHFLKAFKQPGHYRMRDVRSSSMIASAIKNQSVVTPKSKPVVATSPSQASETLDKNSIPASATSEKDTFQASATDDDTMVPTKPIKTTHSKSGSYFPRSTDKIVGHWLLFSAVSVFGIVVFGGLTRLTESGLSITEWRPVTGSLPPMNERIWQEEFDRYKKSPEFIMLNSKMELEDFKKIYWMEWTHRLWGRVIGITTLVPTIYFIARRRVSKRMAIRITGICGLICFQGFIGWWMVKSGLKDDLLETGSHPRVSQYRLAAHLGTAFLVYIAMLSNGLQILRSFSPMPSTFAEIDRVAVYRISKFQRLVTTLGVLAFVTAMSGALVAGLDAGLIYNDFPWMGQGLLPPQSEMLDTRYSRHETQDDLVWRNMFENPVMAQIDHKILATTTFVSVLALWIYGRNEKIFPILTRPARLATTRLVQLVCLQATLGITTLWYLVPTPLAAAHQAGALALLSGIVILRSRLTVPKHAAHLSHLAQTAVKSKPPLPSSQALQASQISKASQASQTSKATQASQAPQHEEFTLNIP